MVSRPVNSDAAPQSIGGYAQAVEVTGSKRRLYISGQVPLRRDGTVPETFGEQASQTWANVLAQLDAAQMPADNLVKVTIFLSDRKYAMENREARKTALGNRDYALTVIIAGIFDPSWLLEIEAIAED